MLNKFLSKHSSALALSVKALGAAALIAVAAPAAAHVDYVDLSDPFLSPGGVNGGTFSNYGWYDGTTQTLGDTHQLAQGQFFKFHLTQDSKITINFSDDGNTGLLNPSFSLYAGLLPDEAHDDATTDPLNPNHFVATPTPHTVYDASPVDNGVTTDAAGHVSPFRDTANIHNFKGQFDALHDWSMANEEGAWAVILYQTHVATTGGANIATLSNYFLRAGDYTIAAAGNVNCGSNVSCPNTNLPGTISLSVTAVPLPASAWLFVSAISGFWLNRRNKATYQAA